MQPQGMLRRTYRITLRRLMIYVVFLALVLGLMRHALGHWGTSEVTTLALTILVVTNVLAWFQKARWQVFWAGFGIFAWSYLVISLKSPMSDYLPTTWLLDNVREWMTSTIGEEVDDAFMRPGHNGSFTKAGHWVISLGFGFLGGLAAVMLFPVRNEDPRASFPSDGSLLKQDWRNEQSDRSSKSCSPP